MEFATGWIATGPNMTTKAQKIIREIGDSEMYTLHAHTQFCDARMPMEEFAEKAAEMGFTHYGFTPHSPIPIESSCNMKKEDVKTFIEEVDRLQKLYPAVRFYKGMEIDYLDASWGPASDYFTNLGLDYTIGSVHFIPNQEGKYFDIDGRPERFRRLLSENFHDDLHYVVDKYFEHSLQMVEAGGFDIIGHFDKIKHNAGSVMGDLESTAWYNANVNNLIDAIVASGIVVEINTKSWKEFHQLFPSQRHWKRLIDAGVEIMVNSDAHYVDRINAARHEVLKALRYLRDKAN